MSELVSVKAKLYGALAFLQDPDYPGDPCDSINFAVPLVKDALALFIIDAYRCEQCGAIEYEKDSPERRPSWPWHLQHDSRDWCSGTLAPVTISRREEPS